MSDQSNGGKSVRTIQAFCNEEEVLILPKSQGEEPYLLGGQCNNCKMIFFPPIPYCQNCGGEDMMKTPLSTKGTLDSFTVVRQQPVVYKGTVPYAFGQVKLADDVNVEALLTGCALEDLELDMDMEMVVEKLQEDDEGNDIVCYKFRPVKA